MAFIQQHRPQSSRQITYHEHETAPETTALSQQLKRPLDQSEEWVLFSPSAPSTTARTHTTSTDRTPRTAGLSRYSEFGSLDTAARSDQDGDDGTILGTEEELDSLDDGLHAFHEPSEYGAPASRLQESGDTVLPTHDGLGEFQPDATMHEHIWQFERPRRRVRRRSSVQRHFTTLDDTEEVNQEQDRRQRIEQWRLEQSKALLEEIEKETRRRRRMSTVSATRSWVAASQQQSERPVSQVAQSVVDAASDSSDEETENLSFWQRITRRVIRDLIGLDEDTLSVIFGEALPDEATLPRPGPSMEFSAEDALKEAGIDSSHFSDDNWQTKLLERVAEELGTLVHQLSEHPGAFTTYQGIQTTPEFVGLTSVRSNPASSIDLASLRTTITQGSSTIPASAQFVPTFAAQTQHLYSEASLWGIEEEPELVDPLSSSNNTSQTSSNIVEDLARERAYWERELDVKMIFSFLVQRFTLRRSSVSSQPPRAPTVRGSTATGTDEGVDSARRAAMIRQHHPLVSRTTDRGLPTSSTSLTREAQRKDVAYRTYIAPQNARRHQKLKSSSSCASQSTKKSKRSGSSRNYWDLGGSVGSGSVLAGEV